MTDNDIIALYWQRSEAAITETDRKYGSYCHTIAMRVLESESDAQECVNDTWLRAWNAMPPQRPNILSAFLGKITRNLSLDRLSVLHAAKRGGTQAELALSELEECVGSDTTEAALDERLLADALASFLRAQSPRSRSMFLLRYWELCPVREIADIHRISESAVASQLHRMRLALRQHLEKEGIDL